MDRKSRQKYRSKGRDDESEEQSSEDGGEIIRAHDEEDVDAIILRIEREFIHNRTKRKKQGRKNRKSISQAAEDAEHITSRTFDESIEKQLAQTSGREMQGSREDIHANRRRRRNK